MQSTRRTFISVIGFVAGLVGSIAVAAPALSRETALKVLRKYEGIRTTQEIEFAIEGFKKAEAEGLIASSRFNAYMFTQKGLSYAGTSIAANHIALAPMGIERPRFLVKLPMRRMASKVTGITDGPDNGKIVEFTLLTEFPKDIWPISTHLIDKYGPYQALLKFYDDGWRVVRIVPEP